MFDLTKRIWMLVVLLKGKFVFITYRIGLRSFSMLSQIYKYKNKYPIKSTNLVDLILNALSA